MVRPSRASVARMVLALAMASLICLMTAGAGQALAQSQNSSQFQAGRQTDNAAAQRLIVHEWGVLTTIGMPDGQTLEWSPLEVQSPLPSFVQQYPMSQSLAKTRFELPAVFFRVDKPVEIAMDIQWLAGYFASCYPQSHRTEHGMSWAKTTVMPDAAFPLLNEASASHYYQARKTTASFIRVDHFGHKQYERFLSLRALGEIDLPVSIAVNDEKFTITQNGDQAGATSADTSITQAILIENIDGKLGFDVIDLKADGPTITPRLKHNANIDLVDAKLRKLLNKQGLYPDEAAAALGRVRSEWFAPGVRVIYLLPRQVIDQNIQMTITPQPSEHLRLYAVNVELITPQLINQTRQQLVAMDEQDTDAQRQLLLSSPVIKPLLAKLLADMTGDAEHLHICDKINLMLKQPLAQK